MSCKHNTKIFTYVDLTETANSRLQKCRGNVLNPAQRLVLEAAWISVSYEEIAIEYGYSPSYITKVASKLWQQLSKCFELKVNKTNVISTLKRKWIQDIQAIYTANIKLDIGFTIGKFVNLANELLLQHRSERLKGSEVLVLGEGFWKNKFYLEIAIENNYYFEDIREVGERLLEQLSEALGEEVNKNNCKSVLEQRWRQRVQGNPIQNKTQLEDRPVDSVDNAGNNSTDGETVENAKDSFDVNLLVEDLKNGLEQKLSVSFDEETSQTNSQAVSTANVNPNTEFNLKILQTAEDIIMQSEDRPLRDVEIAVLTGLWENKKIADHQYAPGHINNTRSELWQLFSKATNEDVNKTNCIPILKRRWQQNTQANSILAQTHVKDCLLNFLFNPLNTSHKSVGNRDNSWKFLVKDTVNKIWQKLSEAWQAKATPENWRAAFQLKLDRDTELTEEIVLQVIDSAIFDHRKEHLNYLQEKVVCGAWRGQTYSYISEELNLTVDHISDTARKLWQKLSIIFAFSERINKYNFKPIFEGWFEDMKSSFISCKT